MYVLQWLAQNPAPFTPTRKLLRIRRSIIGAKQKQEREVRNLQVQGGNRTPRAISSSQQQWRAAKSKIEETLCEKVNKVKAKSVLDQKEVQYNCRTCHFLFLEVCHNMRQHWLMLSRNAAAQAACDMWKVLVYTPRPWHESSEDTWRWCTSTHDTFHMYIKWYCCMFFLIYKTQNKSNHGSDVLTEASGGWAQHPSRALVGYSGSLHPTVGGWLESQPIRISKRDRILVASLEFAPWVNQFEVKSWDNFCKAHGLLPLGQGNLRCNVIQLSLREFHHQHDGRRALDEMRAHTAIPLIRRMCSRLLLYALNRGESEED